MAEIKSNRFPSGLPSGIPYIVGNEAAERFSYYGMKAILVVFMTNYLKMTDSHATDWLHSFGSAVYFFPLFGAIVADVFLGKYKTILSLSIVYCLGHLVLALYETRTGLATGLTLIAIGSGGIKPCVSAHVGDQFDHSNKHLIERVYSYFYLSINMGAFLSTIATPWLLLHFGPSVAFGIPGLLMAIATFLFWLGRNDFIHVPAFGTGFVKSLASPEGLKTIARLGVVYLFVSVFWSLFDQTASTWIIQAKSDLVIKTINLGFVKFDLLPSQIQAANPILVLILVPLFTYVFYPNLKRVVSLKPLKKVAYGMVVAALSFFVVAYIESYVYRGESISIGYQLLAYAILTAAEVMVSITALEFSYTQAPNAMKSFIMGLYLLSVSLGNMITVGVNSWMEVPTSMSISVDEQSRAYVSLEGDFSVGDKIGVSEKTDFQIVNKEDTTNLQGTYVLGTFDESKNVYALWDIHREPIQLYENPKGRESVNCSTYKLNGSSYFNFFAYLMLGTAFVFFFVANAYKEKIYIQELKE